MRPAVLSPCLYSGPRRRHQAWLLLVCLGASSAALGNEWNLGAGIGANVTLTDNVFLAPPGQEQTDLVFGITPSLTVDHDAARLKVHAAFSPTLYKYVQNSGSDYVAGNLNAFATLEAAEKFFYIDGYAQIFQTYISPFGTQPESGASITNNRTQTTVMDLSPYIKSTTSSGISYLLRDDNTYTVSDNSGLANLYQNNLTGKVDGPTSRWVQWGADYNYNYSQFENQAPLRLQLGRLRGTHFVDSELSVMADVGYEKNDYTLSGYHGAIYGAGFDWKPTPRTDIYANAEHRFFGTSFGVGFNHRTRQTAWTLSASRNLQTYPQQLLIPAGNTLVVVDQIFRARIPDPVERQQAVNNFLQQAGLPSTLGAPFNYYTNQIYVVESVAASFALIGARNSLTFNANWSNNTPVTASGQVLPLAFTASNAVTLTGVGVAFSHQLSAYTSLTANANRLLTRSSAAAFVPTLATAESTQNTVWLGAVQKLDPKTSGTLGLRYVKFNSNVGTDYTERALVAGVLHTF